MKDLVPPPRPVVVETNAAEVTALRVLVMCLMGMRADEQEATGTGRGQAFINELAAFCQEAVLASTLKAGGQASTERYRQQILEKINEVLGGVKGFSGQDQAN